jgi:hypothetical protein
MRLLEAVKRLDKLNTLHREDFARQGVRHTFDWGGEKFTLSTVWSVKQDPETKEWDPVTSLYVTVNDSAADSYEYPKDYNPANTENIGVWLKEFVELHNSINVPVLESIA